IISTCPLVFVAVGLMAGILFQSTLLGPRATGDEPRFLWLWLILLAICSLSAVSLFVIQTKGRLGSYAPVLLSSFALVCFLCLGAIRLISFHQPKSNDIQNLVADESKLATIRGLIVTEPYINRNQNWKFARFKFTDPATSFYLKLNEVEAIDGWAKATGIVRVQVDEPVLDLKAGDYIQAYCRLDRLSPPTNPGQFDTAKYLARKNVFIAASVKSRDGIELLQSTSTAIFTKLKSRLRQTAAQALLGGISPEEPSKGLLEALLLGYRGNIDSSTYRAFRKTGLLHFISLSGMHLGILIGIVWWLCKTAGLMKPACSVICIVAIAIFLLIVPPRAPTVRAAIIGWVFCISFFFHRKSNSVNTLSLAAIILLLIRPTQLFEVGWQLSFASVLGILLFCERFHFFLYEKITNSFRFEKAPLTKPFFRIVSRPGPALLRLFSTGVTAWIGGAGILLYHFYTITPFASIWTVVAFPFIALILAFGYLKIILSFLLPTLSAALAFIVALLSDWLIWVVKLLAYLDFSEILIGHVPLALIIFYYCFVLFSGFVYFRRPLIKKVICTVMFLTMIVFLGAAKWQRTHRDNLVITCLDVGHGQAIFVRLPGKTNLLFDAGSLLKSDVGRRVVAPFLDYAGINKIDAIIISHNDIDHINGIPEVIEQYEVGGVYANDDFFNKSDRWGTAKFLNDCLTEKGIKIQPLDKDLFLSGSANIKILWPIEQILQNEELGDNDKSLVSLLEFAGTEILLCSDIEKFAQRELLRLYPDLKADVVVVPHHGSVNTLEANFLERLNADILIYSCGQTQYERQQKMIKGKTNARSFYTPKHGAVALCISSNGMMETKTFVQ
ncbi:MAG: DNA internalization-related competence protein ComEC/Rec2, partial [Sedimentisphaerales bacterium]